MKIFLKIHIIFNNYLFIEGKSITIERNVWIATGVTILGVVTIGENSVVGVGAVGSYEGYSSQQLCGW